jgi:hypothetical protein
MNESFVNLSNGSSIPASSSSSPVDYAGYVFVPLLFVLGIVGNSLTVIIMMTREFRGMPVSKLLIALSVSDTLVNLLFPFNKPFMRVLMGSDVRALSSAGCKLYFWAYRHAKTTSSWMVVLISCERFVAVWLHVRAKSINTTRNAYISIVVVYVACAVFIGYWCSWADQLIDGNCIPYTRPPGMELQSQIFLIVGLSLYSYIPAIILVILNVLIIYKLWALKKKREGPKTDSMNKGGQASKKDKSSSKTTTMLLCVAIAFLILVTPNSAAHLVSFTKKQDIFETTDPGMVFFREVSQVMEQANNSINFILYVFVSKRFRDVVMKLCKTRNKVRPSDTNSHVSATANDTTVR